MINLDGEILNLEKKFNKEKFIDEFTYAYEDIWSPVPSLSLILILILNMSPCGGQ